MGLFWEYRNKIKNQLQRALAKTKRSMVPLGIFWTAFFAQGARADLSISPAEIRFIGLKVWQNEDALQKKELVGWNRGENWASLGIAHFTWYPKNDKGRKGSFPDLVNFLEKHGRYFPLNIERGEKFNAPWKNRDELLRQKNSPEVLALQHYLLESVVLQMMFIVDRAQKALSILLTVAAPADREQLEKQFNRLAQTVRGRYILVDYVNLTGEGGLGKVLKKMKGDDPEKAPEEFVAIAKGSLSAQALARPPQAKWLKGWINRINTYR